MFRDIDRLYQSHILFQSCLTFLKIPLVSEDALAGLCVSCSTSSTTVVSSFQVDMPDGKKRDAMNAMLHYFGDLQGSQQEVALRSICNLVKCDERICTPAIETAGLLFELCGFNIEPNQTNPMFARLLITRFLLMK